MSSLFQIVSGVLRIAVVLGIAGVLVHATTYMGHLALNSSQLAVPSPDATMKATFYLHS